MGTLLKTMSPFPTNECVFLLSCRWNLKCSGYSVCGDQKSSLALCLPVSKNLTRQLDLMFNNSIRAISYPKTSKTYHVSQLRNILTDLWRLGSSPWRLVRLRQRRFLRNVPIFVIFYHRVANQHPNPWSMDVATFQEQILWMKDRFDMISLDEVQRRIASGTNERPAVSITFDDGYAENCEVALPFLIEENVPVTYFVTTEHTTKQIPFPHDVEEGIELPVNTIESLRALSNAGIEIGAHSRTHPDLGALSDPDTIFDEVISAAREMESLLGKEIRHFAFPFGQYTNLNVDVFKLLKESGFKSVSSAYGGWNEVGGDAFHIQRIHGDPDFARMKNWLNYDPRIARVNRYDYSDSKSTINWTPWLEQENGQLGEVNGVIQTNDDVEASAIPTSN